jgi:hypothetical protein
MDGPQLNVKGNSGASVTEVTEIIGGDTANVHGNLARDLGLEYLFLLGH